MTDAEDLKEVAQQDARNMAEAVYKEPADWDPPGVRDLGAHNQRVMYSVARDHEAAQEAVNLLREQLTPMAIKVLAFDFYPKDGSAWAVTGYSPGKTINDAMEARLKKEVAKAHDAASKPG